MAIGQESANLDIGPLAGFRDTPDTTDNAEGFHMTGLEAHYSVRDVEARILAALRAAGLNPEQRLSPEALGALDHFHTGGFRASRVLQELAHICAEDHVLDIGAGLAGAARMLAASPGCRVDCVELSPDYCAGAVLLNRLTGLEDRVGVHRCSALELPFPDASFDAVWMQNVGMNIADKRRLYAEVRRVLKPEGRFAFQEMTAGDAATSYFPLPWATAPAENFLISAEELLSVLDESGFVVDFFEDASDEQSSGNPVSNAPEVSAQAQLSLSVYVDNLAQKAENATRSLQEGQIRFVRGVVRAK
ncbi:MAG: methyltransferase domain-containing protein [Chromatiaceae bacterium]|nr:methyltransferase domain-containing protein [Chromatiaceae bacterium]